MGDKEFEKFLNQGNGGEETILTVLKEKMDLLNSVYGKSVDIYVKIPVEDPIHKTMGKFITDLIVHIQHTLEQINCFIIDTEGGEKDGSK